MPSYLIEPDIAPSGIGSRTIARCSNGQLWCCYLVNDGANDQVWVSYSDDGGLTWTAEQMTVVAAAQFPPSLAIDSQDNIHLVWFGNGWGANPGITNIQYRRRTTAGWDAQLGLTDDTIRRASPSIAVDSQDNVHIAWDGSDLGLPFVNRSIFYREWIAAGWQPVETVIFNATNGQQLGQIALGSDDVIHVLWVGGGWGANPAFNNVQYIRKVTGVWQPREPVTDIAANQDMPAIALDAADNIYTTWGTGLFTGAYRRRTAIGWEAVEYPACVGGTISLDTTGVVYLVGTDGPGGDLWYIRRVAGAWQPQEIILTPVDYAGSTLLWANHPTVGGVKTNISGMGLVLTHQSLIPPAIPLDFYYFTLYAIPIIVSKSYALSRREL